MRRSSTSCTAAGVRQITPIHLIDNGFGGAAIFDDHMNVNQLYLRDTRLEPDPGGCRDERVDFEFSGGSASLVAAMLAAGRWRIAALSAKPEGPRGALQRARPHARRRSSSCAT